MMLFSMCEDHKEEMMKGSDSRSYADINKTKIDMMLKELQSNGSRVTGCNPWDIETYRHGVSLRATWNETTSMLTITVTHSNWYVPRDMVWNNIDSLMKEVQQTEIA